MIDGNRQEYLDTLLSLQERTRRYLSDHAFLIVIATALGFLAYGYEIFNFTLSIDEENKSFTNDMVPWLEQGRWSTFLLSRLFMPESLVPFTPTLFAVLFLVASCFLFFRLIGSDSLSKAVFCALFLTFPSHAYFIEFNTFSFAVSIGIAASIAGVVFLKDFVDGAGYGRIVMSVVCTTFAIGVYQSLLGVCLCTLFLYGLSLLLRGEDRIWQPVRTILLGVSALGLSLSLYKAIDLAFKALYRVEAQAYLDTYIGWKQGGLLTPLLNVFRQMIAILSGSGFYGDKTMLLLWLVAPLLMLRLFRQPTAAGKIVGILFLGGAVVSPFALPVAMGSALPVRTLLALPLMLGGLAYLLAAGSMTLRYPLAVLCLVAVIINSFATTRLFYADHLAWQADRDLANRVVARVQSLELGAAGTDKTVIAFVGKKNHVTNPAFIKSEVFGASFFGWDGGKQARIVDLLRTMGVDDLTAASPGRYREALGRSAGMPCWPHPGSVAYSDGMVIVKLGEPTPEQLAYCRVDPL